MNFRVECNSNSPASLIEGGSAFSRKDDLQKPKATSHSALSGMKPSAPSRPLPPPLLCEGGGGAGATFVYEGFNGSLMDFNGETQREING